ncbi:MAG: CPBP family intramembrane metalloprotease, partial [Gammaproteobacteria bacterium]|nr:CPBP family intramembrane metalloprotease [Gammaproteobacteria bacterium]
FSLTVAHFNADTMPNLPWFPIPVLAVVFGVTWWCDKRWDIGLRTPCKVPPGLLIAFIVFSTLAARSLWVLEKAWHGDSYAAPTGPEGVSPVFAAVYWVAISLALSTSSEFCFRGIMQSQLSRHLGLWSAIGIVVFFNTFAHPWESLWPRFFAVVAILFAWGWLRHIGGSLKVCILTHIVVVMGDDVLFWLTGPVDFGQISQPVLVITTVVGLSALAVSVYLSRLITGRQSK